MNKLNKLNKLDNRVFIKACIPVVVLLAIVLTGYELDMFQYAKPQALRGLVLSFGIWAPIMFVLLCCLRPFFFVPVGLFAVVGGISFGYIYGTIYTTIGVCIGSFIVYGLSKYFGSDFIRKLLKGNKYKDMIDKSSKKHGVKIIFVIRMLPILPVDAISCGAGLSSIRFKDFVIGTIMGVAPWVFVYSLFGSSLSNFSIVKFIIALGLISASIIIAPIVIKKKYNLTIFNKSKV